MDAERFDRLTITLVRGVSRRGTLAALLAGAGTALGLARAERAAAQGCLSTGEPCSDGTECCSGRCNRNRKTGHKSCRRADNQGACTIEVNDCAGGSPKCGDNPHLGCRCYVTKQGHSFCGDPDYVDCDCSSNRECERRLFRGAKCVQASESCNCPAETQTMCVHRCYRLFPRLG